MGGLVGCAACPLPGSHWSSLGALLLFWVSSSPGGRKVWAEAKMADHPISLLDCF